MNDGNENTATATAKSPGRKRTRFTKSLQVFKTDNGWQLCGKGKPKAGTEMGTINVPFDYNRANGVPSDAKIENVRTVNYVKPVTSVVAPVTPVTPVVAPVTPVTPVVAPVAPEAVLA